MSKTIQPITNVLFFATGIFLLITILFQVKNRNHTKPIQFKSSKNNSFHKLNFDVQAVPTTDAVQLSYHSATDFDGEVIISNVIGRPIQAFKNYFFEGNQSIELDLSDFSEGYYFVAIKDGEQQRTQKFRLHKNAP